jgi:hypothetical protein
MSNKENIINLTNLIKTQNINSLDFLKKNIVEENYSLKLTSFKMESGEIVNLSIYAQLFMEAVYNCDLINSDKIILKLSHDNIFIDRLPNSRMFFDKVYHYLFKKNKIDLLNEIMKNPEIGGKRIKIRYKKQIIEMVKLKNKLEKF